jgi:hypothetical protein
MVGLKKGLPAQMLYVPKRFSEREKLAFGWWMVEIYASG